jgi:hypothetical protein
MVQIPMLKLSACCHSGQCLNWKPMSCWYVSNYFNMASGLQVNQCNDIVSQMDRLNLNMERGTAMLSALCEAAGLDVLSILLNVPAHPSGTSSPQLQAATLVASRGATDDGN